VHHSSSSPAFGDEYTEGVVGNPATSNPLLAQNGAELDLSRLTYRGLFQHDANGQLVPDLAQDWSLSPDHKTYLVNLKPSLQWSDGYPLNADDITFTFQTLQNSALKSPLRQSFAGVTIKQQGSATVSFSLPTSYPNFLEGLTVGLLPAHIWSKVSLDDWLSSPANFAAVGSGPWRYQALTRDSASNLKSYTLEPNPLTHTQKPFLTKVILRFYPDTVSLVEDLRQSVLDGVGGNDPDIESAISASKFTNSDLKLPQYTALFYNQRDPLLKSRTLRQALGYAINRTELLQHTADGGTVPTFGPFLQSELRPNSPIRFNLEKTEELLGQAGYKRNAEGVYQNNGANLEVTLTAVDQGAAVLVAGAIKQQWETAGIKVNLNFVPNSKLLDEVITPRNFQVLLLREVVGVGNDLYPFWHSSQVAAPGLNLSGFQNREADRLLSEARQSSDATLRQANYQRIAQILNDDSPATFLYSETYRYALAKDLSPQLPEVIAQPADRFNTLNQWYRKTTRRWNR
jgi:peptide/nickel transport system substrate-binding protein